MCARGPQWLMRGGDLAKIQRPAHPMDSDSGRRGKKQDQQIEVAETFQQRKLEDVKSYIIPEGMIADVKRHPMERFQVDVPGAGFAIGGKNRDQRGSHQHQQTPWNPIAEGAQQLGQVDLGHLVGPAHHPQSLAVACRGTDRRKTAGGNRDEGNQPHAGEYRDLRADDAVEDLAISQRTEP